MEKAENKTRHLERVNMWNDPEGSQILANPLTSTLLVLAIFSALVLHNIPLMVLMFTLVVVNGIVRYHLLKGTGFPLTANAEQFFAWVDINKKWFAIFNFILALTSLIYLMLLGF